MGTILAFGYMPWIVKQSVRKLKEKIERKERPRSLRVSSLTYLAVISIFVIESCLKTIGVHDRVFDVNDKVENSLEPAG